MSAAVTITNYCQCYGCQMRGQGACGCFTCPSCGNESRKLLAVVDINEYGREIREKCWACQPCKECGAEVDADHDAECPELTKWDVDGPDPDDAMDLKNDRDDFYAEREWHDER